MKPPTTLLHRTLPAALGLALLGGAAQAQPFTYYVQPADLEAVQFGAGLWGDYDGDGDQDVLVTGGGRNGPVARLYRFQGLADRETIPGTFVRTAVFDAVQDFAAGGWFSTGAWGDYDRDGDLDVVLLGGRTQAPPYDPTADVYRNDDGRFTAVQAGLPGLVSGAAAWGDYDTDGDLDLLLTGARDPEAARYHTDVYRNDGGTFTPVVAALPGTFAGSAAWGDYDADGDLDILLTGASQERFLSEVYRNDGGTFTALGAGLLGLLFSTGAWGDYDADGRLDLLLTGAQLGPAVMDGRTRLYRGTGGGFAPVEESLRGAFYGGTAWGDLDNDGGLDLLLMGNDQPLGRRVGRFYQHEAGAPLRYASNLPGAFLGALTVADFDGDADLDLLTTGVDEELIPRTTLYVNGQRLVNERPLPPADLQAAPGAGSAVLSWGAGTDAETPAAGLTYNLRVGTGPGLGDVVSPMARPDGWRLVSAPGNAGTGRSWTLRGLSRGTYHWSVQAVDPAYAGSAFAAEGTFTVGSGAAQTGTDGTDLPRAYALHQSFPNPFSDRTTIAYDLPEAAPVALRVYNVLGVAVQTLVEAHQAAGRRSVAWDGADATGRRLSPGVYFYRLHAGGRTLTGKLVLQPR